jgi:hypothetical protein
MEFRILKREEKGVSHEIKHGVTHETEKRFGPVDDDKKEFRRKALG